MKVICGITSRMISGEQRDCGLTRLTALVSDRGRVMSLVRQVALAYMRVS
jgi:hypothetical protein